MANHKSALKRHRQSVTRQARNQAIRTRLRHLVRAVRAAVAQSDANAASESLAQASRALDKAVTKGVVHRNSASRRIARLSHAVYALKTSAQ
ncbi:MAG: 30S ribosomal protein S20 [bacterium]|nr:30S ribosomal protein S20 [bacterium]